MSDSKPVSPKAEQLASELKDALSKRRLKPWKAVLAALVLSVLGLAGLSYWMYPRPPATSLQILALDVICTPEETPLARALLVTPADEASPRRLSGHAIVFHEPRLPVPGVEKPREINVVSDANGLASTEWPIGKAALAEYFANHIDAETRFPVSDRARIFVWPRAAPILVIDVDAAFIGDKVDDKASAALTRAAKDGWRVVYLSVKGESPHEFRATLAWVAKNQAKLPIGPVLGRPHFQDADSAKSARHAAMDFVKRRFDGPVRTVQDAADWANLPAPGK